ncbi:MAG: valine--tRNA ligase [Syntrophomonadaceae bacterium]|nr:valine--tRNA ligase [Syntrophomonadaceae bacterium]
MTESNLSTVYDPKAVEEKWYQFWVDKDYFRVEVDPSRPPFCIVMPPPNVTGSLHLGHALDNTLQDILTRWRRMQGYNALWLPGTDHAGIATQARVEEQLATEGFTKYDLGREKFLERVWDWKHQYGTKITNQLRLLGSSCDWSRERFTMDEGCSAAVREVFIELYRQGLIYRGDYIINWCPKCQTTISDIEVEHYERDGNLWHLRYPIKDSNEHIVVATTRPETMLGDTAVAVHPADKRYQHLIGKTAILPLMWREIPIIADEYVESEFGTGAVKVTPAHDVNDFEMGLRHDLPKVVVIGQDARMTEQTGRYAGMDRYACREQVVQDLENLGLLLKKEEHHHAVGQCYRCASVVEPLVSKQWFVRMQPLAEPAIEAVKQGRTRFVPDRFTRIYLNWLENIRDWCISRQLWWGHRIPVWYCQDCGEIICQKEEPSTCTQCQGLNLEQDQDVLDTWFSSGLWPFSTLGWPEKTPDLEAFYPTSVLVTGRDIIFFWVARMIFSGLAFMQEVPFREVLIHGLILDAQGRKMSKSLGNGVDPIEVIDQYGADTLRFMLITGTTPGNDVRFHLEKLDQTRNFANKVWNASRFVLLNLSDFRPDSSEEEGPEHSETFTLADRWILSRYNRTINTVTRHLENYDIGEAAKEIYEFIWNEYCDWYIELAKPRLYGRETEALRQQAQKVLHYVLCNTLKLLHPFMPFITEEIYQHLPHQHQSIMVAPWPQVQEAQIFAEAETEMHLLMDIIRTVRNLRAEIKLPPGKLADIILASTDPKALKIVREGEGYIKNLAAIAQITQYAGQTEKPRQALAAVVGPVEIYLPLEGLVDLEKEIARLDKEVRAIEQEMERVSKKLNNSGFLGKAPEAIINKEKEKLAEFKTKKETLEGRVAVLRGTSL